MDTTDSLTAPMPIRRYPGRIAVLLGLVALADFVQGVRSNSGKLPGCGIIEKFDRSYRVRR
ncbi:hypothetical protein ACC728_38580, partial [Rhizobium ruizarguesonis]